MKLFFTADTHFGSKRTLELSRRPFNSVKEMDETIINNWNNIINNNDDIWHLGDFGDFEVLKYLNGNIHLLLGNYDRDVNLVKYISSKFQFYIKTKNESFINNNYELTHEPSYAVNDYEHFILFGHVHEKCMMKKNGLNVGVDCHYFKPIDIEVIEFYKNAILNHYDNEVWSAECGIKKI